MINRDTKRLIIAMSAAFSFLFYGLGFRVIYQPDIYGRINASADYFRGIMFTNQDGRILTVLILYILRHMSFIPFYYCSLLISAALIAFCTYRFSVFLVNEFMSDSRRSFSGFQPLLVAIVSCTTIANLFSAEFFIYIDMTVAFVVGIVCSTEASIRFVRSLRDEKVSIVPSLFLWLLPVAFLYETISSLFIVLTVPFIVFYSVSVSDFIKKQMLAGMYYVLPLIIKTVFTRYIIKSERARFDKPSVAETVVRSAERKIYTGESPAVNLFDRITFGMWGYMFLCFALLAVLIWFVVKNHYYIELIKGIYIILVIAVVSLYPFAIRLTNDLKPRIYYPLGALFGVLCIYGVLIGAFNLEGIEKGVNETVLTVTLIGMICIQWLSFVQIYSECYVTNYEDRFISETIGESIDKYERDTGNRIEHVVFYDDAVKTKYSMDGWCLIRRAYSAWNEIDALNMYLDRNYSNGEYDEKMAEFFAEKDWDHFSPDQIVMIGDTAHICRY